jgi:hypothetical protein
MEDELQKHDGDTPQEEPSVTISMRIISKRKELKEMSDDRSVKSVHIAFRPSNIDILSIVKKFPNIQLVQMPKSYRDTISKPVDVYLTDQNIMLITGDVWGHRKDISEWVDIKVTTALLEEARAKLNDSIA